MNGERLLLDTNAVVALLRGKKEVLELTSKARWIGVSIVSYLEFLSFAGLPAEDAKRFRDFVERIAVSDLALDDGPVLEAALRLRLRDRLKLPDAVIGGTAIAMDAALVTGDKEFKKAKEVKILWI
jgi:tRNA(fMet)-specific endonuclease VapC